MSECEHFQVCKNNSKCIRCRNQGLLSIPKERVPFLSKKSLVINKKDKPWEKLEKNVAIAINEKSRRSRASGALPFEKGDVLDDLIFIECKSRSGSIIKKGTDKSLSVSKKWIEKATKEANEVNKPLVLPFQFADDADDPNKIYAIMNVHDIIDLITVIKLLRKEVKQKNIIISKYKNRKEV